MIASLIPLDGSPPIYIVRDVTVVGRKHGLCDVILEHERARREQRLWVFALVSSIGSLLSALAAWTAVLCTK